MKWVERTIDRVVDAAYAAMKLLALSLFGAGAACWAMDFGLELPSRATEHLRHASRVCQAAGAIEQYATCVALWHTSRGHAVPEDAARWYGSAFPAPKPHQQFVAERKRAGGIIR